MNKWELLEHLRKQNFSERIIKAFERVRREEFLPEHLQNYAYEDIALPIEEGQTLSQPSTIAFVLSLLDPQSGQKILEIGAGSGYVLALLSTMLDSAEIFGVEIRESLALKAKQRLVNDKKIKILHRDGSNGLPDEAPFDRILVSAAASDFSIIANLTDQLKENGILVAPVNHSIFQIRKINGKIEKNKYEGFAFVPLIKKDN